MPSTAKKVAFTQTKKVEAPGESLWTCWWCQGKLLTGCVDGTVKLWNVSEGDSKEAVFASAKRPVGVTSVLATQDGSKAVACYQDSTIKLFDLFTHEEKASIEAGLMQAYSLSLSPQEEILVSGNHSGGVHVWSMEDYERVTTIETGSKQILSTAFSFDGKLIASSADGVVNVIDTPTKQILHHIEEHSKPVRSVCFSGDGRLFFSAGENCELNIYDVRSGDSVLTFGLETFALSCDPSPDGRHVVVGTSDGKVSVFDIGSRSRIQRFDAHHDAAWSVAFNKLDAAGRSFASVGEDGIVNVFNS